MDNKKWLLILSVVFLVLLGGAGLLYQILSDTVERESLVTSEQGKESKEPTKVPKEKEPSNAEHKEEVQDMETTKEEEESMLAPDFTVVNADGEECKLSDFFGKPIILNFWASWCGPCKSEMPDFDEIYAEYKEEIQFLMVNMTDGYQETVESAKEYIEEQGYSFPVYYDIKSEAAMAYYVYSIPMTFFIDSEGKMVAYAQSAINKDVLLQGIEMIYEKE